MQRSMISRLILATTLGAAMILGTATASHAQTELQASDAAFDDGPPLIQFGFAMRARYVSVPSWFLGLFTKENTALSTFGHFGVEFLRRKGDMDIALGFSYQNMSPPDGNWLGAGKQPTMDTDYVQFKGLKMYGIDATFVWHTMFKSFAQLHKY